MASTYLTRAFSSGTITTKATWSFWVKFSKINQASGGASCMLFQARDANNSSNSRTYIRWGDGATLDFISYNSSGTIIAEYYTTRLLRDCNSWYHICYSVDTTLAAASDRVKLYINGVRETDFDTSNLTNPGVNQTIKTTSTVFTDISRNGGVNNNFLDGLLSYYIFTDGYTYQADTFGSTDSVTGQWKINTSPTVTYGTNGYFILKNGNSVTDQSGNSNNFTVGAGTLTNASDCPDNVFATWNPLAQILSSIGYEAGNTTIATSADVGQRQSISTLAAFSGKFYMECKLQAIGSNVGGSYPYAGASPQSNFQGDTYTGNASIGYGTTGYVYLNNNSGTNTGTTYTSGDIISVALDVTNSKIYFAKNGTYISNGTGTGNPTTGANPFDISSLTSIDAMGFATSLYNNNGVWQCNFGNGTFGTSTVSSAGTNASSNGIFEYDVPTGYTALSTKGLNL